jgi:hypothetical protein
MSERDIVIGHLRELTAELNRIPADDPRYAEKRQSRQRGIELYQRALARIDARHIVFLEHLEELATRSFGQLARAGRH